MINFGDDCAEIVQKAKFIWIYLTFQKVLIIMNRHQLQKNFWIGVFKKRNASLGYKFPVNVQTKVNTD